MKETIPIIIGIVVCAALLIALPFIFQTDDAPTTITTSTKETTTQPITIDDGPKFDTTQPYRVSLDPKDFTTKITNPYFPTPIGMKLVYEADTEEGKERIEIYVPGWTKTVMGVESLVFWDRVYVDGQLVEDTRDYIAQDKEGNVWYMGEDVDNYVDGKLLDHEGAWLGGVKGALPGLWMPASPKEGDEYRQEYALGEAEDMGMIASTGVKVKVPAGSYEDCVKIFEWSPLFPDTAYKYHCRGIGTVLEEEDTETVKLIEIHKTAATCMELPDKYKKEGAKAADMKGCITTEEVIVEDQEPLIIEMSEDRAIDIALQAVPGKVTDVAIEKKFGKIAYVIEIDDSGTETDVVIDMDTGDILGIET
ncbi:PepSY domain-containing protein [Candidatus Woesearchaeota archaeon]|nr:PepSY domain-containing protein [Candidatus Woesearchaeota archaeon]